MKKKALGASDPETKSTTQLVVGESNGGVAAGLEPIALGPAAVSETAGTANNGLYSPAA